MEKEIKKILENQTEKLKRHLSVKEDGWNSKYIPRLLSTVYHDLITEESWNFVKKLKQPKIDFCRLLKLCNHKVKEILPEVF